MPKNQPVPDPRDNRSAREAGSSKRRDCLHSIGELIAYLPYSIGYHPSPGDVVFVAIHDGRLSGACVVDASAELLADALTGSPASPVISPATGPVISPETISAAGMMWEEITARLFDPAVGILLSERAAAPDLLDQAGPARGGGQVVVISYGSARADTLARALLALAPGSNTGRSRKNDDGPLPQPHPQPELLDVLRVSGGRWTSFTCPSAGCCPPGGRPVPSAPPAVAHAVLDGAGPRATRAELDGVLQAGPAELLAGVAGRLPSQPPELPPGFPPAIGGEPAQVGRLLSCQDGLAALQQARESGLAGNDEAGATAGSAARAATALLALENVLVRDQCIAWADTGAGQLWRDLIGHAPPGWRAPAATVLGAYAYTHQDPALARTALRYALDDRPGYSLAHMLLELMAIGADPADFAEATQLAAAAAAAQARRLDAHLERPGDTAQGGAEGVEGGR